jgi:putative intracellular protease/amidase
MSARRPPAAFLESPAMTGT